MTLVSFNVITMPFVKSSQDLRATGADMLFFFFSIYNTVQKAGSSFFLPMSPDQRTYLKQIVLTSFITTQASNARNSPMSDTQLIEMFRSAKNSAHKNMLSKKLIRKRLPVSNLKRTKSGTHEAGFGNEHCSQC